MELLISWHRLKQFSHLRYENQLIKRIYMMTGKPRLRMACCATCTLCEPNRCHTCWMDKSKSVHACNSGFSYIQNNLETRKLCTYSHNMYTPYVFWDKQISSSNNFYLFIMIHWNTLEITMHTLHRSKHILNTSTEYEFQTMHYNKLM